jgi:hypothetical protein
LVEATQELAQQEGTNAIILQVEADNLAARQLYERLGFENLRTFTRWRRHPAINPPDRPADMPDVTLRSGREWKAEYNLAQTLRPNERGGLGWLRPTWPGAFRKTAWQHMRSVFSTRSRQRWVVRGNAHLAPLRAAMSIETVFGSRFGRVDLLVAPEEQGTLEKPVLNFAIRHLHDQRRGLIVEHPSDDEHATEVFYDYRFEPVRHLVHMQWRRSR